MTLDECRRFYAEEIRYAANIHSQPLLDAFARIPRENFLGPGPWQIPIPNVALSKNLQYALTADADPRHVYHNCTIALDTTRDLNNGQPSSLARWIEAMEIRAGARVFHLGCGVGYFTAIMAELAGPNGKVLACEVHPELAARARRNLSSYPQVEVREGDGAALDPGECDAMLINAGVTHIPPLWLERLREGGRLVVPLTVAMGSNLGKGVMAVVQRRPDGFAVRSFDLVAIYNCASVRDPQFEPLIGKALQTLALMKVRSLRTDEHAPEESCVLHLPSACWSSREPASVQAS